MQGWTGFYPESPGVMVRGRGTTTGVILAVISMIFVLGLALSTTAVFHLDLAARETSRRTAVNLADPAPDAAMSQLLYDPTFGLPGATVPLATHEGSAQVVFASHGAGVSTNNLKGMKAVPGASGESVPAYSALLYATATSGSAHVLLKAILTMPDFPYVIATAGPFVSTGALAVQRGTTGADTGSIFDSTSTQAIVLSGNTEVDGDVGTSGSVVIPTSGVQIGGSVQQNQEPVRIPIVAAEGYDPGSGPGVTQVTSSNSLTVQGLTRSANPLILGNVVLQNGVLYVVGDLEGDWLDLWHRCRLRDGEPVRRPGGQHRQ